VAKIAILWHLSTCSDAALEFTPTLKRIQQSLWKFASRGSALSSVKTIESTTLYEFAETSI